MKEIFKVIAQLIVGILVVLILARFLYYVFMDYEGYSFVYNIKFACILDALESSGEKKPLETYKKFRQALVENKLDVATNYIFETERENFKEYFKDSGLLKQYLAMPDELNEVTGSLRRCSGEEIVCKEEISYYKNREKVHDIDYDMDYYIYDIEIDFKKNLLGRWQIEDIKL